MLVCEYVFLNLKGEPATRSSLARWKRIALQNGEFLHEVDPCVLENGHAGDHVLTSMPYPESVEDDLKRLTSGYR